MAINDGLTNWVDLQRPSKNLRVWKYPGTLEQTIKAFSVENRTGDNSSETAHIMHNLSGGQN